MRRRNLDRKRRANLSTASNETGKVDLNQVINDWGLRNARVEQLASMSYSTALGFESSLGFHGQL